MEDNDNDSGGRGDAAVIIEEVKANELEIEIIIDDQPEDLEEGEEQKEEVADSNNSDEGEMVVESDGSHGELSEADIGENFTNDLPDKISQKIQF